MRTLGRPSPSTLAMDMALASLGSDFSASAIQAAKSAMGSSFGVMPPSSIGPPISLMAYRLAFLLPHLPRARRDLRLQRACKLANCDRASYIAAGFDLC